MKQTKPILGFDKPFIVSCQALENEAMFGEGIMLKFAQAALNAGADFIRTSQVHNIKDIKNNLNVPIIGLIKKNYPNSKVVITPTIKEVQILIENDVDIIAIDATLRTRPKEDLNSIFKYMSKNKKSYQLSMADCSSIEDVRNAIELGFDTISTTLHGYTKETQDSDNTKNDFAFIKEAVELCSKHNIPVIAEGGLNTPESVNKAYEYGADGVVVGSAITRPEFITSLFIKSLKFKNK